VKTGADDILNPAEAGTCDMVKAMEETGGGVMTTQTKERAATVEAERGHSADVKVIAEQNIAAGKSSQVKMRPGQIWESNEWDGSQHYRGYLIVSVDGLYCDVLHLNKELRAQFETPLSMLRVEYIQDHYHYKCGQHHAKFFTGKIDHNEIFINFPNVGDSDPVPFIKVFAEGWNMEMPKQSRHDRVTGGPAYNMTPGTARRLAKLLLKLADQTEAQS